MKLNTDCIRDVLLYLEENLRIDNRIYAGITLTTLQEKLSNYSSDDVFYTVDNLRQAGFIDCQFGKITDGNFRHCSIYNITYQGHQFLESIRPETIWKKTKSVISTVGVHALSFIENVAHDVAVETSKQAISVMFKQNP